MDEKIIYFDNAATTKMDREVIDYISEINDNFYANPSAIHKFGYLTEQQVNMATKKLAELLSANMEDIIWTSGGTESNNMALMGVYSAYKKQANIIVTSKMEHSSVGNVCENIKKIYDNAEVVYVDVDKTGHIDIDKLVDSINEKTLIVSVMMVNNEIGSYQDIETIGRRIKEKNNKVFFHVDAVQAFGKYKINVKKMNIDLLSISTHKFYGPKGVGILYKRNDIRMNPIVFGGGQQYGLRSGTVNVPGIMGTIKATELVYDDLSSLVKKLTELRNVTIDKLEKLNEKYHNISINTKSCETFAPHIVSVTFSGIKAEVMVHALEEKNIFVSAGSACSTHSKHISNTLVAIGLSDKMINSTIRISFGKYNEMREVDRFIEVLDEILPLLMRTKV